MRKIAVGVMGSSSATMPAQSDIDLTVFAAELGKAIAESDCVCITGETSGIPGMVAKAAADAGGLTVGISPAQNPSEQKLRFRSPEQSSAVVIYTGFGLKGRNVINVRSSDIVVVAGGSFGTLNEFTIAYDEGKVIGVAVGTGGVSDVCKGLLEQLSKETGAVVIFESDPRVLLENCLRVFQERA